MNGVLTVGMSLAELYYAVIMTILYELAGTKPQEVALSTAFVVTVFTAGSGLAPPCRPSTSPGPSARSAHSW